MKGFLLGLVAGALAVWLFTRESSGPPVAPSEPAPERITAGAVPPSPSVDPQPISTPPRVAVRGRPSSPFEPGECWVRIGEGYVFGEDAVRVDPDRAAVDFYCQDIRHGASLHCPHGAGAALAPMTAIGLPVDPAKAAALVTDAPLDLPERDLQLGTEVTWQRTGIGFVRAATGAVYKLHLAELDGHPEALERRVRIVYEPVPQLDSGGGELRLPTVAGAPDSIAQRGIRAALDFGERIPGQDFGRLMSGSFEALADHDGDLRLSESRHLVVDGTQRGTIVLDAGGALFAPADLLADSALEIGRRGGAVGVGRDLSGRVAVDGYGYAYVGRDVLGLLDLSSYATAVILGDLRGTVKVRSYIQLHLRGRMLGTLDVHGSCWSTFYFQSFMSRAELEAVPGDFRQVTLHLMQSDLPDGSHEHVGTWREVIVGDPVWRVLAR